MLARFIKTTTEKDKKNCVFYKQNNILYIFPEKKNFKEDSQSFCELKIVELEVQQNYYFVIFEILTKLFPQLSLSKRIEEFKKQYEAMQETFLPSYYQPHLENKVLESRKNIYGKKIALHLKNIKFFVSLSVLIVILILFWNKNNFFIRHHIPSIQSELKLLPQAAILDRSQMIFQIEQKLKQQEGIQTVALVGIGGAGKSTLARQYARKQKASVIWELSAETKSKLKESFENLAQVISSTEEDKKILKEILNIKNIPEKDKQIIQFVKEHLKRISNWILIYDNIENFKEIKNYFPQNVMTWGQGKVVLTTRDSNIQTNSIIDLRELNPHEKLNLFLSIISNGYIQQFNQKQKEEAKKFLEEIPPFPLDISIAAYYLKSTNISYEKYLSHLRDYNKDFANLQENILNEATDYTKTRYSIITLTLQRLINTHKDFSDLLLFISLLDSQNIPRELLEAYKDEVVVESFLFNLKKYSLITSETSASLLSKLTLSIHRSTQEISLAYLIKLLNLRRDKTVLQTITYILKNYIATITDKEDFSRMKILLGHCETFLNHSEILTSSMKGLIGGELGFIYYCLKYYNKARRILEESIKELNKFYGKNHISTAAFLLYLGIVDRELGSYERVKDLLNQSLSIYKKYQPSAHTKIARILAQLGIVERDLGNYDKAKELLNQSLIVYKKYQPTDHAKIAWTLSQLGLADRNLGNFEKAKSLFEKSLIVYKKYFAEDHRISAWVLVNLGIIEKELGSYAKARALFEKSLLIYKKYYSEEQLKVAWVLVHLGILDSEEGNYEKAKILFEKSLLIYKKYYSENYGRIAWILVNLGIIQRELGNYKKAKELFEESLLIYKKSYSEHHVRPAWVLANLGKVYSSLGEYKKAKHILEESLKTYTKIYGDNNVETARVLNSLGKVYLLQGYFEKAESFITKALEIFKQHKHPENYICLESLAELYFKKAAEAENKSNIQQSLYFKKQEIYCLKQALQILKTHFSSNSPHVIRIQSKLDLAIRNSALPIRYIIHEF